MSLRGITIFNEQLEKTALVDNLITYSVTEKRREVGTFTIWVEATPENMQYLETNNILQFQFSGYDAVAGRNFALSSNTPYTLTNTGSFQDLIDTYAYKVSSDAEKELNEKQITLSMSYTASGVSFASGGYCKLVLPYTVGGVSKSLELNLTDTVKVNGTGTAYVSVLMDSVGVEFAPIQVSIHQLKGAVTLNSVMLSLGATPDRYAPAPEDDMSIKYPNLIWGVIVARVAKDTDDFHGIEITGNLLEDILRWRCVFGRYTAVDEPTSTSIINIITNNFISPADPNRAIPWLALDNATIELKNLLSFERTGGYVSSLVYDLLFLHPVGVKAIYDSYKKQVRFYFYRNKDRSQNQTTLPYVVFSDENGMLVDPQYTEDHGNYKNVAIVAGEDDNPASGSDDVYIEAVNRGYTGTKDEFYASLSSLLEAQL